MSVKKELVDWDELTSHESSTEQDLGRGSVLWAGRQVKIEVEIGPEVLQPSDFMYSLQTPKLEPHSPPQLTAELSNSEVLTSCSDEDTSSQAVELNTTVTDSCAELGGDAGTLQLPVGFVKKKTLNCVVGKNQSYISTSKPLKFKCLLCDKLFTRNQDLKTHMLKHTGERPFKCSLCEKSFTQSHHLKQHVLTHTGEKLKCSLCDKQFTRNLYLKTHMLTHTGERPFKCSLCDKTFTQGHHLKQHILTHTGKKPFKCSLCAKQFTRNQDLKMHMLTHSGEIPFICALCEKPFTRSQNLKTHMLSHTGERPFKCSSCDKHFTRSHNLKTHMLTHTGERPV